jgi:hypothetical protein
VVVLGRKLKQWLDVNSSIFSMTQNNRKVKGLAFNALSLAEKWPSTTGG